MAGASIVLSILLSTTLLSQPVLVDHIIAICDYYVVSKSDIEQTRFLIEAGVPTILDKDELLSDAQDSKKAILKELLIRYLANKKAYQFQMGKEEAEESAKVTLDSLKSSLDDKGFLELLKKTRMSEEKLLKEIEMWARAKIFLARQLDIKVQLGKKRFYEKNRNIFTGEYLEEEDRVVKTYYKKLLEEWLADEVKKSTFRTLDEAFIF